MFIEGINCANKEIPQIMSHWSHEVFTIYLPCAVERGTWALAAGELGSSSHLIQFLV